MKKILLWAIGLVVALVVLGVVAAFVFLNPMVKRGVETVGPQLTKVDVKLAEVNISPFSGSGTIQGLVVGNPEGFKSPHAIAVSNATLALKPGSLLGEKLIINSIVVHAPEITLEVGLGGNNLGKILDNLNETTAGSEPSKKEEEKKEGRRMQVDEFVITGAKVHGSVTGVAQQSVTIPDIRLTQLGTNPEGITAGELSKQVLAQILEKALEAASKNMGELGQGIDLKGITDTNTPAGKAVKGLGDLFKK